MVRAIRQNVTVQPGGRIELTAEELPAGTQAEVIVLLDATSQPPRYAEFFGSGRGAYASAEEADAHIRRERDAWEH